MCAVVGVDFFPVAVTWDTRSREDHESTDSLPTRNLRECRTFLNTAACRSLQPCVACIHRPGTEAQRTTVFGTDWKRRLLVAVCIVYIYVSFNHSRCPVVATARSVCHQTPRRAEKNSPHNIMHKSTCCDRYTGGVDREYITPFTSPSRGEWSFIPIGSFTPPHARSSSPGLAASWQLAKKG